MIDFFFRVQKIEKALEAKEARLNLAGLIPPSKRVTTLLFNTMPTMNLLHETASPFYMVLLLLSAVLIFALHSLAILDLKLLSRYSHPNTAPTNTAADSSNQQTSKTQTIISSKRTNKRNNRRKNSAKMSASPTPAKSATPLTKQPSSYPSSPASSDAETLVGDARVRQPFDAFLVVDFEATCAAMGGFDYPNEIIVRDLCIHSSMSLCQ